jgi:hypothetical protein
VLASSIDGREAAEMVGPSRERREHPRIPAGTDIRLRAGETECKLLDISCSGLRFQTVQPPPLMSLLEIRLELPGNDTPLPEVLHCQGAVVRTEVFGDGAGQEVAVFFTRIEDTAKLAITDYVRRRS